MGRPALPVGSWGKVHRTELSPGRWEATARFRDYDGKTREVSARGATGAAAERALVASLSKRVYQPDSEINANTRVSELAAMWLEEIEGEGTRTASTLNNYRGIIESIVVPALGDLRLRELTVSRADRFLKTRAKATPSQAERLKMVLRWMMDMAVRHEAIPHNPLLSVAKVHAPRKEVRALDEHQLHIAREAIRGWRQPDASGKRPPGPPPSQDLVDIIDLLLATGVRINELLGLRWCDVEFGVDRTTVTICGTLVQVTGRGLIRQSKPKTRAGYRVLTLPTFAVNVLLRRRVECPPNENDAVFATRTGRWMSASNFRRAWRQIRQEVGLEWVTPHSFRKTVATIIEREVGARAAASQLGHASPTVTEQHYIERNRIAPDLTEVLQRRLRPEDDF